MVPALIHDGRSLHESGTICEYLDEVFPEPPLRPADAWGRAQMRNWIRHIDGLIGNLIIFNWVHGLAKTAQKWSDAELAERLKKIPSKERQEAWIRAARRPYTEEERAAARARLVELLDRMESAMNPSGWLAGGRYSIADIAAVPFVKRIEEEIAPGEVTPEKHPRVAAWWKAHPGAARFRAREHRAVRGPMRLATRSQWLSYAVALRFAAIMGGFFGAAAGAAMIKPPLAGALIAGVTGVVDFTVGMAFIGAAEIFLPRTRLGRALARLPFFVSVLIKAAAYLVVVLVVVGGRLGPRLVGFVAGPEVAAQIAAQIDASFPLGLSVVVAALVTLLLVLLRQAGQLVGERTFRMIVRGRYRRPRAEERFFLFIDIVGSTPVAEKLGALSVHRYLNRIFQETSDPVDDHGGEVYQYVGDEIVVTWLVPEGRKGAKPLACFFAIEAALAAAAPEFEREFGTVPKLRAALHAGEVVTGEAGGSRRAIVFHGDVMNATSRIENLTRTLGHPFLVSEDARARMEGTGLYEFTDLGPQALRGREAPLRVYSVAVR